MHPANETLMLRNERQIESFICDTLEINHTDWIKLSFDDRKDLMIAAVNENGLIPLLQYVPIIRRR